MKIQERVKKLHTLVLNESNEKTLVKVGEKYLNDLRKTWMSDKNNFSKVDIDELKWAAGKIDNIKIFIEEQEEFSFVSSIEETDNILGRLYLVIEDVDGLKVAGRVSKEIRELIERKSNLPSQAVEQRTANLTRAVNNLNSKPPSCKKCKSSMILREANSNFFWGCLRFPECWGKKVLTKKELEVIQN